MTENFETNSGELGDYEILGKIAQGGMGIVYCARQKSRNRAVAIKMIRSGQLASAEELERFRIEAKAAAHLDHPNIVPIYEVGELNGQPFFSMKLIEGGSLREHIEDWGAADEKTQRKRAALVAKIARAVHHAHTRGILHRDIKPTNILLDKEGEPYLGDFGLARIVEKEGELATNEIAGTPTYMAPEQAFGPSSKLTTAADIYSLGAIFYHLLVGRAPFVGTRPEIFQQLEHAQPEAISKRNPRIDKNLETICLKCLAKDPQRRYRSAEELAEDIERWFRSQPIWARPGNPKQAIQNWARRHPAAAISTAAGSFLLMAALAGILFQWQRAETSADENRETLVRLNAANGFRLWDEGDAFGAAVWFIESLRHDRGRNETQHRIRLASVFKNNPSLQQMIFPGGPVHAAEFSPDTKLILTSSGTNRIGVWNSDGTAITNILHEGEKPLANFRADGQRIFSRNGNSVKTWSLAGELISTIVHTNLAQAAYSSNSKWIATADIGGNIIFWSAKTGEKIAQTTTSESAVSTMAFAPNGKRLMVALRNGAVTIRNPETAEIEVSWKARGDLRHAAFNATGARVVTAHSNGEARVWDAVTGAPISAPMKENSWVTHAAFSPEGNVVALSTGGNAAKIRDATTGAKIAELTGHRNVALASVYNSDGNKIATYSVDGTARIFNATNGAALTPLLWHGALVTAVAFDASSKSLLTASADGAVRIWALEHNDIKENGNKAGPPTDNRPFDQLNAYVQSITAHRIDRTGTFASMEGKKLEAAWKIATRPPK